MIAARVKFLQSSGRIEWRQEVLRAVSSARRRKAAEGILSLEIQSAPPTFFAKCISFPTMDCFRKRERQVVRDGVVISGSNDGDKSEPVLHPFPNYRLLQRTRPRIDAIGSSIVVDQGGSDDSDDGGIP